MPATTDSCIGLRSVKVSTSVACSREQKFVGRQVITSKSASVIIGRLETVHLLGASGARVVHLRITRITSLEVSVVGPRRRNPYSQCNVSYIALSLV